MKDQLWRPVSFCSVACLLQLPHFSFSFDHFALAAFHCLLVHFDTSSAVELAAARILSPVPGVCARADPADNVPISARAISEPLNADMFSISLQSAPLGRMRPY